MPRDARLLSKWRVFVDGVEIPHLGMNLTFSRNMYASGAIIVEPDLILHDFRPNSIVTIWFFDPYGKGSIEWVPGGITGTNPPPPKATGDLDDLLNNYRLYFMGEFVGLTHSKSPQSRNMGIQVAGLIRIFQRHKMFAQSIGGAFTTTTITGGFALPEMLVGGDSKSDILSFTAVADLFFDGNSDDLGEDREEDTAAYRSSVSPDFAERLVSMAAFLSSFNGSLRLSTARTRLLNTIASFPDATLKNLLRLALGNKVLGEAQGKVGPDWSLLDVLTFFASRGFYSWYQIPGPYTPPDGYVFVTDPESGDLLRARGQPEKAENIKMPGSVENINSGTRQKIYSIKRDFYRNDYLFLPELYFAFPPPCNFLFPEDIDSINYQRVFDKEPTRFILIEPYFTESKAQYVAPPWLLRNLSRAEQRKVRGAEFFSENVSGIMGAQAMGAEGAEATYDVESPYISKVDDQTLNLLAVLSDSEIEKGIIPSMSYHNNEMFSAISRIKEQYGDDPDVVDSEGGGVGGDDYTKYMNDLAMYRFQMENAQRECQVGCTGHKWIVPGFNALICDKDSVYIGFVESITLSVDVASSTERTSLALSKVRHIPYQPPGDVDRARVEDKRRKEAQVKKKSAASKESYIDMIDEAGRALANIRDGLAQASASFNVTGQSYNAVPNAAQRIREGVTTLNKYGNIIGKSLYAGVRPEAGERYLAERPQLATKGFESGATSDDVAFAGGVRAYTDALHLPLIPSDYATDGVTLELYNVSNRQNFLYQAQTLTNQIQDYIGFQIKQLEVAAENGTTVEVDSMENASIPQNSRDTGALDDDTKQEIAEAMGFFSPPAWFNQGLLRASSIDEIYKNLLGCQPFYTALGISRSRAVGKLSDEQMYQEYIAFLQTLDKVFPFLTTDTVIPTARDPGEKALWEQLSEKDDLAPNPHVWMNQHIQRRDVTTMRTFLKQYGLKLTRAMSYDPTPTVFYKMVPDGVSKQSKTSPGVGGYPFDNSIFSMIVDEWEMFPEGDSTSDPAIARLRSQVRNPALTRVRRQEIVESYAKRHFGARGFDGR